MDLTVRRVSIPASFDAGVTLSDLRRSWLRCITSKTDVHKASENGQFDNFDRYPLSSVDHACRVSAVVAPSRTLLLDRLCTTISTVLYSELPLF